jgi:predicted SnoaL-like aldol condensation-catalyzing enzyme
MIGDMHKQIKNIKADVITSAGNGDYVFSLIRVTGSIGDTTMAGNSVDEKGVDVVKFKDHKITDHWRFIDDVQVSKEMMEMQNKMNARDKNEKVKM